ncbi:hypothetical protein HYQ45_006371 [Verticillium longisporum]|uniref:Uncharacterized protein n=1 Tax=Verticillium longisporum TaxID=100787 RepID=A0A8I3AVQ9_VERLO|nr:hypothetical protein HYQ45_006371 [Verticillium longisporum]
MGTPFISLQEPTPLDGYLVGRPHDAQPPSVPKSFSDAMEVRTAVFIEEQGVPAETEFDADDSRCCHWVVYASVNQVVQEEVVDANGNITTPRRSSTRSTPIGTVRLVPFPHAPHPKDGGEYWDGVLKGGAADGVEGGDATAGPPGRGEDGILLHEADRATSLHDGKEPYVKLGRLAVVKGFRGHGIAKLLVGQALGWLRKNPTYFDPSIKEQGLESLGAASEKDIPKWGGLVCVHSQEQVTGTWERFGFNVDEEMGRWKEEGIWHRGMFMRLELGGDEGSS